ncbi:MAG: hypothetical protein KA174_08380 [Chitinophagales bacterium]|nr:hypothetical protein [Chitinophagales bacterium]
MKNAILLFISTVISLFSCKKENNRIGNITYQLDSVRIEGLDANDSSIGFNTFPLRASFIDTIIGDKHSTEELNFLPGFYTNEDSLIYVYHPEFFDLYKAVTINKVPISILKFNPVGGYAQYGFYKAESFLNYQNNQLNNINIKEHEHIGSPNTSDKYTEMNNNFIYTNNNLNTILSKRLDYSYDEYFNVNFDSVIYPDLILADFTYTSNIPNQKNLIGIDLNDLILNNIIGPSDLSLGFYFPLLILGNRITYQTNSSSLIEKLRYTFTSLGFQNTESNFTIQYIFDANNNNRISTMKIKDDSAGSKLYTFYYKD